MLDRGFYSVAIIRYLQVARYPFIMPVIGRGRKPSHPQGPSGTQVFAEWKRSGGSSYTLTRAAHQQVTVGICVHCWNWRGRRQRHGRQTQVYAFWGLRPTTPHGVFEIDRYRFGIETRNPTLRLLFVGIALRLRNVWVWVHGVYLASPRRGNRKLNLHKLRFKALLMGLTHLAEETFWVNDRVVVERVP